MKIRAKVKLVNQYDFFESFEAIKVIIVFRDPSEGEDVKINEYLCRSKSNKERYKEFLDRCEVSLNMDNIKFVVKTAIQDYFKKKDIDTKNDNKFNKIQRTIKELNKNKIEFEFEI